jgi:acyl-CoA dehydrogenase
LAAFHNLPYPWLAKTLRTLMFPYGKPFSPPDDALIHQVARLALEPSATRDRLTVGIFITNDPADRMGRIEDALHKTLAAAELEKSLNQWMKAGKLAAHTVAEAIVEAGEKGLLDKFSVEKLLAARRATANAVRVDDFPADYFRKGEKEKTPFPSPSPARGEGSKRGG